MRKQWRWEETFPDPVSWEDLYPPAPVSQEIGDTLLRRIQKDKGFTLAEDSVASDLFDWTFGSPLMMLVRKLEDTLGLMLFGEPSVVFDEYLDGRDEAERVYHYAFYLEGVKDGMRKARQENAP